MQRYCFIILLLLSVFADLQAQLHYNVYVRNDKGEPIEGVIVYTFPIKAKGEAAYKVGKADVGNQFDKKQYSVIDDGKTDGDGLCVIRGQATGSIILDGGDSPQGLYGFELYHIDKYQKSEMDLNLYLVLSGKDFQKREDKRNISQNEVGEFAGGGKTEDLAEVLTLATPMMDAAGGGVERHGKNSILIKRDVDVSGEYARGDARFVAFPKVVYTDYEDSVVYMPPMVVAGMEYASSRVRRMSFQPSRDLLNDFNYDAATFLEDHQSERVLYAQWARIEKGTSYRVPGILWYEDNNGVYHQDSLLFSDGKEREPMRFLNWDAARKISEIDPILYEKQGTYVPVNVSESFDIQFEVGKSSINLGDTLTVSQRDKMLSWMQGYANNRDAQINKITVRGYSSPEGSEASNRTLSRARATAIKNLLAGRLGGVKIETEFDEYDNIVPWDAIADIMTLMDDTTARRYADEIRLRVGGMTSIDAQNKAVMANHELYAYVKAHSILEKVRRVEIEASILEQRVLSRQEIIERYTNDPNFRESMAPYQYYHMLCHLAEKEDWDELYKVSKRAYETMSKERVRKQMLKPGSKDSLQYVDDRIPYPLAGYYYALSTMRKGLVDTEILKPYLDDGPVGVRKEAVNSLPFIVAQVLMYCQDEAFDGADNLIRKYNLIKRDELKGLIMFVRCLDGQYADDQEVRDYVMSTSPMNMAVILTALGKYAEALTILYGKTMPENDPKVEYMKAICHFRMLNSRMTSLDCDGYSGRVMYYDDEESKPGIGTSAWAAPMLNAIRLEPENARYLENDGYFNNAYRQMVLYFWKRVQQGVPVAKVAVEYDALIREMKKNSKPKK